MFGVTTGLALGVLLMAGTEASAGESLVLSERFTVLGYLPEAFDRGYSPVATSPDFKHVAFVTRRGGQQVMITDGKEGGLFDAIAGPHGPNSPGGPMFSADSEHLAYFGRRGSQWFVVVDREVGPPYKVIDALAIGPHGRLAYAVGHDGKVWLVINGREVPLQHMASFLLQFGPKDQLAYVETENGKHRVVINGEAGPEYDGISGPPYVFFSPNGLHYAYVAQQGGKSILVVDGKPERAYDSIGLPNFSGDDRRLAHYATRNHKWLVVVDGCESPEYDDVLNTGVRLSSDGAHVAYAARIGWKWRMVLDGHEGPASESIVALVFSPDSKHVAYVAGREHKHSAVIDGKEGPEYDYVGSVVFSPDSKHTAYAVSKDRKSSTVVLDGSEGPWLDGIYEGRDEHVPPLFSPDSAHLAYAVVLRNGQKSQIGAVRDGKVLGTYEDVDPATFRFSPDSAHLAWVARNQDVQCIIIDGQETEKQFRTLFNNRALVFDSSNHLHAFIGSEARGELARLDVDIALATPR